MLVWAVEKYTDKTKEIIAKADSAKGVVVLQEKERAMALIDIVIIILAVVTR